MTILSIHKRAFSGAKLDSYPAEALKRVDRPTTFIDEERVERADCGPDDESLLEGFQYPISRAQDRMAQSLMGRVDGPVGGNRAPGTDDPEAMARHIKATAYFLRADIVGICRLPPYAVYSRSKGTGGPVECSHEYAIAILVDQDWKTSRASHGNDRISSSMSLLSDSTGAFISSILADYIRRLGHSARAHHVRNYQVMIPPILLWAGLGEMCRIGGIVLNPFLGARFGASVVTTDLPLAVDKPVDFGLQDFCAKCEKCAKHCPSGAIPYGRDATVMHNGYVKWNNDVDKCTRSWKGNELGAGCAVCIQVCPWNKPFTPFHRFVSWLVRNIPVTRKLAIWGDDLVGYGVPNLENKWWFDVEGAKGVSAVADRARETFAVMAEG